MAEKIRRVEDVMVVGTDTGVGKTVVSVLLMRWLLARGFSPFYMKPFQTGCRDVYDTDSDALFVCRHARSPVAADPADCVVYCHAAAKAPYFAARDAGAAIDIERVAAWVACKRKTAGPLVIEAAGGLLAPITAQHMVIDLIRVFKCRPLLVSRSGLGAINHSLLSIEALKSRGLTPLGVVLVTASQNARDAALIAQNRWMIERAAGVRVSGPVPFIGDFDHPPEAAFAALDDLMKV